MAPSFVASASEELALDALLLLLLLFLLLLAAECVWEGRTNLRISFFAFSASINSYLKGEKQVENTPQFNNQVFSA